MRFLVLLLVLVSGTALAKPKVAVAPIKGDRGGKVAAAVTEALAGDNKVIDTIPTQRTLTRLGVKGELEADDAKKVMLKLGADALVTGKLDKDDGVQSLKVVIFRSEKTKPAKFTIQFKTVSPKFKEQLKETLAKKLGNGDDDDDDAVAARKKKKEEEERRAEEARKAEDERKAEEARKKKKDDDDRAENDRKKKKKKDKQVAEPDPEPDPDTVKVKKKRKKHAVEEEETPRRPGARLDAGAFGGVRRLTYTAMQSPPSVGTRAIAARVEGEIYPLALGENPKGAAAGLGLALEFEKSLGLTISLANNTSFPIDQGHYSLGGRFRLNANATTTVVLGLDYAASHYIADRTAGAIDFPDTDYKAVVPSACVMKLVKPAVGVFGKLSGQLILDTGPIQERDSYGAANVYGLGLRVGTDIGLSERLALRFAGDFTNISFKFKGNGDAAMARGVTAAADRVFGISTTLAVTY